MPKPQVTIWVLLLAILTSGCQSHVSRKAGIEAALRDFEATLRWQNISEAYRFLRPELQPAYLPPGLNSMRVVGYDVLDRPVEVTENVVVQRAEIKYVNKDTQIMRTVMDEQVWESDDDGKTWMRANPMPAFP